VKVPCPEAAVNANAQREVFMKHRANRFSRKLLQRPRKGKPKKLTYYLILKNKLKGKLKKLCRGRGVEECELIVMWGWYGRLCKALPERAKRKAFQATIFLSGLN
jgi:hypothetical protein